MRGMHRQAQVDRLSWLRRRRARHRHNRLLRRGRSRSRPLPSPDATVGAPPKPWRSRNVPAVDERADELNVRHWRPDQFIGLGFDRLRAKATAESAVDLAQARRLVALGCPPESASRILI